MIGCGLFYNGAWCMVQGGWFFFLYDSISTSMAFLRVAFCLFFSD